MLIREVCIAQMAQVFSLPSRRQVSHVVITHTLREGGWDKNFVAAQLTLSLERSHAFMVSNKIPSKVACTKSKTEIKINEEVWAAVKIYSSALFKIRTYQTRLTVVLFSKCAQTYLYSNRI